MSLSNDSERRPASAQYHAAHLAFARATIVEAAATRQPILDLLREYTADVVQAERDRLMREAPAAALPGSDSTTEGS